MRDICEDKLRILSCKTLFSLTLIEGFFLCTLPLKSLSPLASVWSKTTLNTGGVGEAGVDPQTCKMGTYFPMSLTLCTKYLLLMPILNAFQ